LFELKDVTHEITKTARDAAYVVIGLGVLGFQRAQVRRRELIKYLTEPQTPFEDRFGDARSELGKRVREIDSVVEQVIDRIESTFEPIEERLPAQARDLVRQARSQARDARQQLRSLLHNAA
jgi:DNA-directed RNA polymerase